MALSGSVSPANVLLKAGIDRDAKTPDGRTARDLAEAMGWAEIVALLS